MIRAHLSDGRFLLGIDAENVRRLKAGQPIRVDLTELGGHDTVIITYGETMSDVVKELQEVFGSLPPAQPMPKKGGMPQ